jgi:hypothetical protein
MKKNSEKAVFRSSLNRLRFCICHFTYAIYMPDAGPINVNPGTQRVSFDSANAPDPDAGGSGKYKAGRSR